MKGINMSYEIKIVNRELANNSQYIPENVEHLALIPDYKPFSVDDDDMIIEFNTPTGAFLEVNDVKFRISFGHDPQSNGFVVKRILDSKHSDPVIQAWGDWTLPARQPDGALNQWFRDKVGYIDNSVLKIDAMPHRLSLFAPMRSKRRHGYISIYQNSDKYLADLHTPMKPGKAISTIAPELDNKTVDGLVTDFLDTFAHREYTVKTSSKPDDFRKVYTGRTVGTQNVNTTGTYKSLASSCMRYTFDDNDGPMNLAIHPTEVYGSGDFDIIWVEDAKGFIGGRVVVYMKHDSGIPQPSYIYGACQQALDMLKDYLDSIDACDIYDSDWSGARLLAVKDYDTQAYIGPYLDLEPRTLDPHILPDGTKDSEGNANTKEYLVIGCGELDGNGYQGIYSDDVNRCYNCEENVHEDDTRYSEYTGNVYCDCCFNDEHFYCDWSDEYYHNDQRISVWYTTSDGSKRYHDVAEGCDGYTWCEREGEYWDSDEVIYVESEDSFVSPPLFEEEYFCSDWDGEVYHNSLMVSTIEDETVSKDEIDDHNSSSDEYKYKRNDFGIYMKSYEKENNNEK